MQGGTQIDNLTVVPVGVGLQTIGAPPPISPNFLAAGGTLNLYWNYNVTDTDSDPLISTVRVRGVVEGSQVLYGQDQASLDLITPGLNIAVDVLEPTTDTVLRGAEAVYEITVSNTNSGSPLCNVQVSQYRRDPDTGLETLLIPDVPMAWGAVARRIEANGSAVGVTTYLVTSADKDPLDMIFKVTADSDCTSPLIPPLSDRTTAVLDISDAQVNAILVADLGSDGVAEISDPNPLSFTFVAQNVGAVTLENLSATWCIKHRPTYCGLPFDPATDLNPKSIGSFEDTTGRFTYRLEQPPDGDAAPFIAEVTMIGFDNKGNEVSIKASVVVPVATADITVSLTAPQRAAVGDTIPVGFTLKNLTTVTLNNVHLYNLLVDDGAGGFEEVAFFPTILGADGQNTVTGTFDYTIQEGVGINKGVLTLVARAAGTSGSGTPAVAIGTREVRIVDMVSVIKTGDPAAVIGEAVDFAITITNQSFSQTLTVTEIQDAMLAGYGVTVDVNGFTGWTGTPGTLGPGQTASGEFDLPDPPGVSADSPNPLVNVAVVEGTRSSDNAVVWDSASWEVALACPVDFRFQVMNMDEQPDDVLGEQLRWHISFRNISSQTLTFAGVTESLFFGDAGGAVPLDRIKWPGAVANVLAPGETAVLIENPGTGSPYFYKWITNEFYGPGDDSMPDTMSAQFTGTEVSDCQETIHYPLWSPVWLTKTADPAVAFAGEVVTYKLRLENVTEADDDPYHRYSVTVYDPMFPDNPIKFNYDGTGPKGTGILEPGQVVETTLTRTILPTDPEELTNRAWAEFPDPSDPQVTLFTEAEATVITRNPIRLTKTPSTRLAVPGTQITYDYTITNIGNDWVTGIEMTDDVVGDLIPGHTGGTIDLAPGELFTDLVGIPYNIPLTAPDPLKNTVTATGMFKGREISNSITRSVDLQNSEIEITKYARITATDEEVPGSKEAEGTPVVDAGTEINYCFLIRNTNGSSTFVDNIIINDTMFPTIIQTDFQEAVVAQLGHSAADSDLLNGQETLDFCLDPTTMALTLGDPVYNKVSIDGVSSGGSAVYSEDELTIDIKGTDLLITKMPSSPLAFVGDVVTYTITISNTSASLRPIVDIEVTDTRAGAGTVPIPLDQFDWRGGVPGVLEPGASATYTYTYKVENTDPDPLENVAAATGFLMEAPNPPDEWTPVADSTRAVVAVTASQLIVNKTASPTMVRASPENCEVKTGIGDDAGRPACRMVHYTITIANGGSFAVQDITADDTYFDAETSTVRTRNFAGADLVPSDDLEPSGTAAIFYDLPVPTASQLAANPNLDPFINSVAVQGFIATETGTDVVSTTADAAVDILVPNVRILKLPVTLAAAPGQPDVLYSIVIANEGSTGETLTGLTLTDLYHTPDDPADDTVINLDAVCPNDDPSICPFTYGAEPFGDYDGDAGTPDTSNPREGMPYRTVISGLEAGLMAGEQLYGDIRIDIPATWTANEFTNIVEITGLAAPGATAVVDRSSATIDIRPEGIQVEKIASVSTAAVGDPVEYTVRVTNIGATPIDRLVIADNAMDGDPDKAVTVEDFPGKPDPTVLAQNETYEFKYTHTLVPTDDDPYVNRVTVNGFSAVGSVVSVAQAAVDIEAAELYVTKTVCAG